MAKKRHIIEYQVCPSCQGKGEVALERGWWSSKPCIVCEGKGKIVMKEEITEE